MDGWTSPCSDFFCRWGTFAGETGRRDSGWPSLFSGALAEKLHIPPPESSLKLLPPPSPPPVLVAPQLLLSYAWQILPVCPPLVSSPWNILLGKAMAAPLKLQTGSMALSEGRAVSGSTTHVAETPALALRAGMGATPKAAAEPMRERATALESILFHKWRNKIQRSSPQWARLGNRSPLIYGDT